MLRTLVQYSLIFLTALGLLASQLLIKSGLRAGGELSLTSFDQLGSLAWRIFTTPMLLLGYGISGVTAVMWLVILSRLDLSYATFLMSGVFYVLLVLASVFVLGENMTIWRWIGTFLVMLGIILISRN